MLNFGLPWWLSGKESTCNAVEAGDSGSGNPLQNPCLENPMNRGAWGLQFTGSPRVGPTEEVNTHARMLKFSL